MRNYESFMDWGKLEMGFRISRNPTTLEFKTSLTVGQVMDFGF